MTIKEIEQLKQDIFSEYRLERYQHETGDFHFRSVPKNLWILWYGEDADALSLRTMDYYYRKCKRGEISENELFNRLTDLRDAFTHEFELLNKANTEGRR